MQAQRVLNKCRNLIFAAHLLLTISMHTEYTEHWKYFGKLFSNSDKMFIANYQCTTFKDRFNTKWDSTPHGREGLDGQSCSMILKQTKILLGFITHCRWPEVVLKNFSIFSCWANWRVCRIENICKFGWFSPKCDKTDTPNCSAMWKAKIFSRMFALQTHTRSLALCVLFALDPFGCNNWIWNAF